MGIVQVPTPTAGRLYQTTRFTSSGSFTVPSTTDGYLDFWVVGGGGGGGRCSNGSISQPGGGGAPGVVNYLSKVPVAAGTVLTVTIGAGGNGQTVANNNGSTGSNTTISGFADSQTITSSGGKGGPSNTGNNVQNDQISSSYYGYMPGFDGFNSIVAQMSIGINGSFTYAQPAGCNYAGGTSFSRLGYSGFEFLKNPVPLTSTNSSSSGFISEWFLANFPLAFRHATQGSSGGSSNGSGGSSYLNTRFAGQGGNGNVGSSSGGSGAGGGGGGGGGSSSASAAGAGGAASANSGSGGGGGGGSSSTGNSGIGGNGGSGFVIISGWY